MVLKLDLLFYKQSISFKTLVLYTSNYYVNGFRSITKVIYITGKQNTSQRELFLLEV